MNPLLAITTCQANRKKVQAIRDTWAKDLPAGLDLHFFFGGGEAKAEDEIILDCPDDYRNFPLKVQAMRRWAYVQGYEHVCKVDDDVYIRPERLLAAVPFGKHYVGRTRGPSGHYPAAYNSGFCYWLDREAIECLLDSQWNFDIAEDRWTANELLTRNITAYPDYRYGVCRSRKNMVCQKEPPRRDNLLIAGCEFEPDEMLAVHWDFEHGVKSQYPVMSERRGPLQEVNVMIKTFLRDGYLYACLKGLQRKFKECKIVVVDDGYEHRDKVQVYASLRAEGHETVWLTFDSGFGAKANAAIEKMTGKYCLVGSDDFDFENPMVRPGVEKMLKVLEARPDIGVVSGRVGGRPYESLLEIDGSVVREVKGHRSCHRLGDFDYMECDLTVNWSLVRMEVFDSVQWDEGVKIGGGEHGAFFLDVKTAGWKVAVVPDAHIHEFLPTPHWYHQDYKRMRARAKEEGRPCLRRRGITKWICQDGREEIA